ncbi:MAG TPA: hypothetical protein VFX61_05625 [Micromonosporaceae bacterium]|nr:hypothetical protein [Micromonosporaceae bacterium]
MRMARGQLVVAVLGVVLVGAAGGCGSDGSDGASGKTPNSVSDAAINDRIYECLAADGFAVTRGPNGQINFADPEDEQFAAYQTALRQCRQELVTEGLLPALDEESLREEYRRLAALQDCLAANGFETLPFPSEEVYLERREELNLFALNTEEEWASARESCGAELSAFEGGPAG